MTTKMSRSISAGVILIILGIFFLYENIWGHVSLWTLIWRYFPLFFIWIGLHKAYRYFRPCPAEGQEKCEPSFSGALVWTGLGIMLLLVTTRAVPGAFHFFGSWWPVLLILLGIGKLVDALVPGHSPRVRGGEVVFIIFLVLIGFTTLKVAQFDMGNFPMFHLGESKYRIKDFLQNSYRFTTTQTIPLQAATGVVLTHENGNVEVVPSDTGEVRIQLDEKIYAGSEDAAKAVSQALKVEGQNTDGPLRIRLQPGRIESGSMEINIRLAVPAKVTVQVENNNGDVQTQNLNNALTLNVRGGDIRVKDHQGAMTLNNRYNHVLVEESAGETAITGLNSNIDINGLKGNLTVSDKNGEVSLSGLTGNTVATLNYTGLTAEDIQGDLTVQAPNSTIQVTDMKGKLQVENSAEKLRVTNLDGAVNFKTRLSRVELEEVTGLVTGQAEGGRVDVTGARNGLTLTLEKCRCSVQRVQGEVKLTNSLEETTLAEVQGAMDIRSQRGSITFRGLPDNPLTKVRAFTEEGDIYLVLRDVPTDRKIILTTTGGFLRAETPAAGLTEEKEGDARLWRNFKGNPEDAAVRCVVQRGDIRLKKAGPAEEE